MTRVSENSTTLSIRHTLNKHKSKMEDLQMKGTTLKSMRKPSDNPAANIEALQISSVTNDNAQFKRNADFAILQLNITEKALENLTDVVNKAKEIARSLAKRGIDTTLISGPTNLDTPENVNIIKVETANEMFDTVLSIKQ